MNRDAIFEVESSDRYVETKHTFDVVVIYDDRAARRAMKFFSELVREFGDEFEFHCDLWRFDWLDLPKVRSSSPGEQRCRPAHRLRPVRRRSAGPG
jgi:hypothetical protein